ncbi:SDR family NAD(P)-dependent oxidoreductase [Alistipes sp.]|uniref:SDR family NAD(P)-dependent oxidoreductase n=1 Tax=Alistipes sp. TaxID=1872444 RepID=UPI0023EF92A0|nr:SDR family NAD(P)-dependent oxidoreductase [Alistipes sp.]
MEKRKRNSETAGAAAQGGTPAGYRNLGDKAGCREHAAEPQGRRMERGAVAPGSAWALVTGAGSGIGRCYALRLAALGYRLVIAGDNRAPLEAVAEEIRNARPAGRKAAAERPEAAEGSEAAKGLEITEGLEVTASANGSGAAGREPAAGIAQATGEPGAGTDGNGACAAGSTEQSVGSGKGDGSRKMEAMTPDVRVIAIDLARVGAAQELYDRMAAEGIGVDVVINNAGIFSFCDILATPAERIERIILLHDLTVTQLCRLFAADMVRRGVRGHILNMSSYSLWMPFPGLALYSASKAYMRSFSVAFAKEVRERGIRVTAVCPAGVATDLYGLTPYWQRIGCKLGVLIPPDSCARRGLKALWRGRRCIVPDWWNRAWIPFCKVLPMWVLRPVRRFTMKFQK